MKNNLRRLLHKAAKYGEEVIARRIKYLLDDVDVLRVFAFTVHKVLLGE